MTIGHEKRLQKKIPIKIPLIFLSMKGLHELNPCYSLFFVIFQEIDPYQQLEKLKVNKKDLLQKIATLKQQILDIESQEDEALRGVGLLKILKQEA